MLQIKRNKDQRVVKSILHRIADIPGGVTVKVADLGGSALLEGTPLKAGSNGMMEVVKTASVASSYSSGTSLEVGKGHHFKVNDYISPDGVHYAQISAIDKSDAAKDTLTISASMGVAMAAGTCLTLVTLAKKEAVAQGSAATTDTTFKVDKGHAFHVGDIIAGKAASKFTGKLITAIQYGTEYDIITVGAQLSVAIVDDDVLIAVNAASDAGATEANQKSFPVADGAAIAVAGSNEDIVSGDSLFVSAWPIAVVREGNAPAVNDTIKAQLKGVIYV